ncbi:MAG: hypothetical protein ABFR82_17700 [Nitrospirota bacterium]
MKREKRKHREEMERGKRKHKAKKGKELHPGWRKKLSKGDILDNSIYSRGKVVVPLGKDGIISIEVEGTIFKLHEKTRKIIRILD